MASSGTGNTGFDICVSNTFLMPPCLQRWPAMMVKAQSLRKAGEKKGKPLIWSQWVWDSRIWACLTFFWLNQWPSMRMPVPASSTMRWPPTDTSMQEVLPPNAI